MPWQLTGAGGGVVTQTVGGAFPGMLSAQQSTVDNITDDAAGGVETAFATVYSVPANFFVANKFLIVFAGFEYIATGTPPTLQLALRLGTTKMYQSDLTQPDGNKTRGFGSVFVLGGTAAAGASVAVLCSPLVNELKSSLPLPGPSIITYTHNVATNGVLSLNLTAKWASNPAGTNTVGLRQLLVFQAG